LLGHCDLKAEDIEDVSADGDVGTGEHCDALVGVVFVVEVIGGVEVAVGCSDLWFLRTLFVFKLLSLLLLFTRLVLSNGFGMPL
jgi:hypothetical protein